MIAVVTGGGRGIGRACAIELARRGADVALLARHASELDEAAARVKELGTRALAIECDVADASAVAVAAKRVIEELGVPDVVVANAGVVRRALVSEMDESDWDLVLDVNLKGTFLTARAFVPAMVEKKRGRFVAIGSISSTLGTPRQSAYCAAKWGTVGFVKSLAEELRGSGVQAVVVNPGSVDTDMLHGSGFEPQMSPEDVAKVVAFAALDAPDAMNGSAVEMFGP
jgi:NAD(P)-dependent dehydrogenase (short-subunit alcohol dehydrogenase family)